MGENWNHIDLDKIGFHSAGALIQAIGNTPFYVAPYQRGYRWGESEINYLLNDIWQATENRKYSLQPIAVVESKVGGKSWELVDGQQRLTTLYLILATLNKRLHKQLPSYSINYNTRETTAEFLKQIRENALLDEWLKKEESPEELWEGFTENNPQRDNIDNFHLFQAYVLIHRWFSDKDQETAEKLTAKILENTYLIWHPINLQGQSVEDRFININAGKIKLTDAELIKALFILKLQRNRDAWDIKQYKIKQLAEEWDAIEKQLHDDDFWYFINQKETDSYQTRVGLLFDILSSGRTKAQSPYDWFAEKEERLAWDDLLNLYHRLTEWYNDLEVYHKVGFLINAGIKQLEELVEKTKGLRKSKIKETLNAFIHETMKSTKQRDRQRLPRFSFDQLSYEDDKNDCQIFLLLYNIKLLENTFPGQRFPFHLYRNESWSLEHIHPQNPKAIKSKKHALPWLTDFSERANELEVDQKGVFEETITQLQNRISEIDTDNISLEIQDELTEFTEKYKDDFDLHGILNLALLDKETNSGLNNKPFKEKRDSILRHETRRYIPLGTLDCFLKKASAKENIQLEYWSSHDMEGYQQSIASVLKEFFPDEKEA
ncbi:DUF262 domain-containing protein [Cyclobacterium salsum]|uniref:DUF262 domain-containing protein n=1 Tax=Cyclobacterium salsum TaxID=2666329 RepID=UPI0013917781|nr:DUF262 domain-containing protein [Cyclobacterium salsum]